MSLSVTSGPGTSWTLHADGERFSHIPPVSRAAATMGSITAGLMSFRRWIETDLLLAINGRSLLEIEPSLEDSIQTVEAESVMSSLLWR